MIALVDTYKNLRVIAHEGKKEKKLRETWVQPASRSESWPLMRRWTPWAAAFLAFEPLPCFGGTFLALICTNKPLSLWFPSLEDLLAELCSAGDVPLVVEHEPTCCSPMVNPTSEGPMMMMIRHSSNCSGKVSWCNAMSTKISVKLWWSMKRNQNERDAATSREIYTSKTKRNTYSRTKKRSQFATSDTRSREGKSTGYVSIANCEQRRGTESPLQHHYYTKGRELQNGEGEGKTKTKQDRTEQDKKLQWI